MLRSMVYRNSQALWRYTASHTGPNQSPRFQSGLDLISESNGLRSLRIAHELPNRNFFTRMVARVIEYSDYTNLESIRFF